MKSFFQSFRRWFTQRGLSGKLVRLFLIQVLAISAATMLGVYAAAQIVENVLVREALEGEAKHFWSLYDANPDQPLPNTNNMIGFMAPGGDTSQLPAPLEELEDGYWRAVLHDDMLSIVHVSSYNGDRLYLAFDQVQVSSLALFFGIAPLSAVLMLIYLLVWMGYVRTRRAVSPVVKLARSMEAFDSRRDSLGDFEMEEIQTEVDSEAEILINAFKDFASRVDDMLQRERNFTRNASHELRTPLTVLRANLELLQRTSQSEEQRDLILARMRRTVRDMESLLETLLLLARESESRLSWGPVSLNELLAYVMEQESRANAQEGVSTRLIARCELQTNAPEKVLSIIFANLLRNAFLYTDEGEVRVEILPHAVAIQDTGCGMTETDLDRAFEPFYRGQGATREGYGLGLAIVSRLCRRFGWVLEADSEFGAGTRVTIRFPRSQVSPIHESAEEIADIGRHKSAKS
ncbi:MAG: HAMP domain-containing sensor histidine kinase [Wenzhouxiangellaceae bacterium]